MAVKRKRYNPSDEDRLSVEAWVLMGAPVEKMARQLGIGMTTLYKCFGREIEAQGMGTDGRVLGNLIRQVSKDDIRAVPGALAYVRQRVPAFKPSPSTLSFNKGTGGVTGTFTIVNDPEEGLEAFKVADDGTMEVSGHEPSGGIDPDPDPIDESK